MCQDTGTAIVMGKRGELVLTGGDDERSISLGIQQTYETSTLRFSQMAPLTMWDEQNTGTNLPAQIELYAAPATPTSCCSWPRAAARPTRATCTRRPRRC